jgi:predicted Zn-dependent protease with MMP-like domain
MAEESLELDGLLEACDVMIELGQTQEALIALGRLRDQYPDAPEVCLLLGDCYYEQGDLQKALDSYMEASFLDSDWVEPHASMAFCLIEMGRLKGAWEEVKEALKLDENCATAHHCKAILLEFKGRHTAAQKEFTIAHKLDPERFFVPVRATKEEFDSVVQSVIQSLPSKFRELLKRIQVIVKPLPEPKDNPDEPFSPLALGAFDGFSIRDPGAEMAPCSIIYLYQKNIERVCRTKEDLVREIQVTLIHEVGHFFGLEEEDLQRLRLD